jgi:hypothetical protein
MILAKRLERISTGKLPSGEWKNIFHIIIYILKLKLIQ